ncbi:MAG: ABC transporter ATP-binding protein [Acidobacteriia bacterium]|nr:ABC transporter ATP-binding protein [Terriglobia bacterium]
MNETATQTVVRLDRVGKTYGSGESAVHAVEDVSLELEPGKFFILMGPSGSGKTTLLMLMGCLLRPTSGVVYLFDRKVSGLGEAELPRVRRDNVGFIFQGFNLFPALTALENVEATLNLKGLRGEAARAKARDLLGHIGLAKRLHHLPEDLSGGEKQRVAVARALAGNPPIILADEPTGQLDSKTGRLIVEVLKDLAHNEGRLIFMVSHDTRILGLADRIFTIDDGHLKD